MSESDYLIWEKHQLLGIFSAEVWILILDNVKEAADFQRISSAFPYLGILLQPRATQVLFSEVLQILTQQQPPYFSSPVELLPLRQVCHAWKSGVDQVLEDPEHHYMFEREQWEKRYLMKRQPTYVYQDDAKIKTIEYFPEVEDFTKFQQHFNAAQATAHSSNPLFCREVFFDFPLEPRNFPAYLEACLEFLQTYGSHVWYCFLILPYLLDFGQHRQFYSVALKQLLALMPNLRSFSMNDTSLNNVEYVLEEPDMEVLLQDSMAGTPVSELRQLRMVRARGIALPFLRALVQKNPQVRSISDTSLPSKAAHVSLYLEQMPNLTALELKLNRQREFEAIRDTAVNCRLRKLHLNMKWGRDEIRPPLESLFRVLEGQFSTTLTDLSLKFHERVNSQDKDLKLRFPRLKKLSVTFRDQLISLDFVLPLKDSLEQLTVGVRHDGSSARSPPFAKKEAKAQDRSIKLYQFWVEPRKSNAWTLFPKLKLLRTTERHEIYSCTRERWIANQPK